MADTALTTRDLQARVDQGVAWLDQHHPGWWRTDRPDHGPDQPGPIDLDRLDMGAAGCCVLGHLLGNYYRAEISIDDAVACGFDSASSGAFGPITDATYREWESAVDEEFAALTELWRRVIVARRAEAVTVDA